MLQDVANVTETVVSCLSLLSELEPICGIALALNLAYLNLPMFRYKEELSAYAIRRLDQLGAETEGDFEAYAKHHWFWNVCILADSYRYKCKGRKPTDKFKKEWWNKVYRWCFQNRADLGLTIAFTAISLLILVIGVMLKIGWIGGVCIGINKIMFLIFTTSILALLSPIVLILLGWTVKKGGKLYIDDAIKDAGEEMSDKADKTMEENIQAMKKLYKKK